MFQKPNYFENSGNSNFDLKIKILFNKKIVKFNKTLDFI